MFKKLLLAVIAVSALALLWTEANAQSCVRWRNVGGSQVCARWSTGSVDLELIFRQDCGPEGTGCGAFVDVETNNSIAFCVNPKNPSGPPRKTTCTEFLTFGGPANQCELDDNADDPDGQTCKSTTEFTAPAGSCQAACTAAGLGAVVDVTPIKMDTQVRAFAIGEPYYEGEGEDLTECPEGSTTCGFDQHCTIARSRIEFNRIRSYECDITDIFVPSSD